MTTFMTWWPSDIFGQGENIRLSKIRFAGSIQPTFTIRYRRSPADRGLVPRSPICSSSTLILGLAKPRAAAHSLCLTPPKTLPIRPNISSFSPLVFLCPDRFSFFFAVFAPSRETISRKDAKFAKNISTLNSHFSLLISHSYPCPSVFICGSKIPHSYFSFLTSHFSGFTYCPT